MFGSHCSLIFHISATTPDQRLPLQQIRESIKQVLRCVTTVPAKLESQDAVNSSRSRPSFILLLDNDNNNHKRPVRIRMRNSVEMAAPFAESDVATNIKRYVRTASHLYL